MIRVTIYSLIISFVLSSSLVIAATQSNRDSESDLTVYHNEEFGYEVKYPKTWRFKTDLEKRSLSIGLRDFVWIGKLSVQVWDMSLYSYDQLSEPPPSGIDKVKVKQIIIDGYSAKEISYVNIGDAGSGSTDVKEMYILRNNLVYKIECSQDCDRILPSFKFVK